MLCGVLLAFNSWSYHPVECAIYLTMCKVVCLGKDCGENWVPYVYV